MQRATMRWLAPVLAVCAVTITVWFVARVNEMPDYGLQCNLLGGCTGTSPCSCPTTEDICVWGVLQKLRWERICAFLFLCVMSLSCFALMIDRWLIYTLAGKQSKEFKSRIATAIHENRVEEAIGIAALYPASPVAAVVSASLSNQSRCSGGGMSTLRPSMQARHRAIILETEDLKRGLWALAALGWAVPLVGFLLFITGVIMALNGMKAAEGTGIAAIAGGLAESLWATVFSTLVAIPTIWSHRYFASRVDTFSLEMDRLSLAIIDQVVNHQQALFSRSPRAFYITQELKSPATKNGLTV